MNPAAAPLLRPSLGARPEAAGARFRVWAPEAARVEAVFEDGRPDLPLEKDEEGYFQGLAPGLKAGGLYRYRVDGQGPFPDPASRFQPQGVHGPSRVEDPDLFNWTDEEWRGLPFEALVFYELHVGTFTPKGTFAAAAERLPYLKELGVTAVELMPAADFPGDRNWGYDGVSLFAPARCYGEPDDLRLLVDKAHGLGLAVFLDAVYNHLGPDGNYLGVYSPHYFTDRHQSPWGAGVNLDGPSSGHARSFFIENALRWIHEYHFDGLRLDATHALTDDGPRHFLAELSAAARDSLRAEVSSALSSGGGREVSGSSGAQAGGNEQPLRRVHLVAEDHRNLARLAKPETAGGYGLDAVWADDFHHVMRRLLAGDSDGYFQDFQGTTQELADTLNQGWLYCGRHAPHFGGPRGTPPDGLPARAFVIALQNHDQVGNRALGERLHHQIEPAAWRAASALLLFAPRTPLLFMGQEWAASSPFQYFTDHNAELGRLVTEGRRREFKDFAAFADPAAREKIPDPQALSTFEASRLRWEERGREPHASVLRLYQALLRLRAGEPALRDASPGSFRAEALDETTILLRKNTPGGYPLALVVRLKGAGAASFPAEGKNWSVLLTTEDPPFSPDPAPPAVETAAGRVAIRFRRPSAVVLKADAPA
ncbi:MAG: malto-oligosyltrehalose trehalohydrolase [Elusimicrobiota bacterium]